MRLLWGPVRALIWLGRHELGLLVAVVASSAGIWIFAEIADEVMEGETESFDRAILLAMRNPDDRTDPVGPPAVEDAIRDVTALGGVTGLALLTLAVGGFLILDGKLRMAAFLLAAIATGWLASSILKLAFERPRPDLVPHGAHVYTASFPSGHSMMSALTYLTLGALLARSQQRRRIKAYLLLVSVFLTAAVGLSRVYLGVHWPTDVLAGWTAGAVWAVLCWIVARWLQQRRAVEREAEHTPTPVE
jgi:undecaprenyl-diphosphatase